MSTIFISWQPPTEVLRLDLIYEVSGKKNEELIRKTRVHAQQHDMQNYKSFRSLLLVGINYLQLYYGREESKD